MDKQSRPPTLYMIGGFSSGPHKLSPLFILEISLENYPYGIKVQVCGRFICLIVFSTILTEFMGGVGFGLTQNQQHLPTAAPLPVIDLSG